MNDLNQELSTISRVVVQPKYRSIGLGAKLIRESMPQAGTPCVEKIAVMVKYNPFAEKAGMKKILEQKPPDQASRLADLLSDLGFDLKLLGSQKHVFERLQSLKAVQLVALKEKFIRNDHPRFRREFAANRNVPYGTSAAYAEGVLNASTQRVARLVKITGMLLQTKVYLYWRKHFGA
jgi:hypothetical protein